MQFIDLAAQQERIRDKIDLRIKEVLKHGKYIMGPEVAELESRLADFTGVRHCITCSSGTDALLMPLMAWGIGPGDAVFTTPFTFIATSEVIRLLGATPVFVDVDETFNINPKLLEQAIVRVRKEGLLNPRAVIPVDLFGLPANYPEIEKIAEKYGIKVMEDGAQGLGGEIGGQKACSFGNAASTSFFPAKPLGCYGDGGAIFTNDDELSEKLRSIRVHGKGGHKYDNVRTGLNGRLDTIQAAILLEKLDIFPEELKLRDMAAQKYTERIQSVKTPVIPNGYKSAWAQYSVLAESSEHRSELQARLKENNIPSVIYYPKPLHLQTAYEELGHRVGDFPRSEGFSQRIFSLPMHPYLSSENIELITNVLNGEKRNG